MNREVYTTDGEYKICYIKDDDRENYVELHRQINGESSLFLKPQLSDMMWESTIHGNNRIYSIFDGNNEYCGSIDLQNPSADIPEIGIDLLEIKRNKGIAPKIVKMFARTAYKERNVEYFLIKISSQNSHSRHVFEKMGAVLFGEEENEFKKIMKKFSQTMEYKDIHEVENILKNYFNDADDEIIYKYKLMPDVFETQGE